MHQRVFMCVITFLSIRSSRRTILNEAPKEIVDHWGLSMENKDRLIVLVLHHTRLRQALIEPCAPKNKTRGKKKKKRTWTWARTSMSTMVVDVFDVVLEDICCGRVRKASFVGLINSELQTEKLVHALKVRLCIAELDLSRCVFGDAGLWIWSEFLKAKDCCVTRFSVEACRFSKEEMSVIWDAMKTNLSIKRLNVSGNMLGWSCVAAALKKNNTLLELDVKKCHLGSLILDNLLKHFRSIRVFSRSISRKTSLGMRELQPLHMPSRSIGF